MADFDRRYMSESVRRYMSESCRIYMSDSDKRYMLDSDRRYMSESGRRYMSESGRGFMSESQLRASKGVTGRSTCQYSWTCWLVGLDWVPSQSATHMLTCQWK